MPVRFNCPVCNQLLGITARKVGMQVTCPKCKASVTVPGGEQPGATIALSTFEQEEIEETLRSLEILDRQIPAPPPPPDAARRAEEERHTLLVPRAAVYFQGGLLAAVALFFFAAGYWIGGAGELSTARPPGGDEAASARIDALLQYGSADVRPDAGAVVLVLPMGKQVTDKIDATSLRPSAPAPHAASPVINQLQALGGAYGRTNAEGRLEDLMLPRGGKYYVLLVSNHLDRSSEEPRPEDLQDLGTYLASGKDLIGSRAYRLTKEDLAGDVVITHRFERK